MSAMMSAKQMEGVRYTEDEVKVIRSIWETCDTDRTGKIHINQLHGLLHKLGKSEGITNIT